MVACSFAFRYELARALLCAVVGCERVTDPKETEAAVTKYVEKMTGALASVPSAAPRCVHARVPCGRQKIVRIHKASAAARRAQGIN